MSYLASVLAFYLHFLYSLSFPLFVIPNSFLQIFNSPSFFLQDDSILSVVMTSVHLWNPSLKLRAKTLVFLLFYHFSVSRWQRHWRQGDFFYKDHSHCCSQWCSDSGNHGFHLWDLLMLLLSLTLFFVLSSLIYILLIKIESSQVGTTPKHVTTGLSAPNNKSDWLRSYSHIRIVS